MLTPYKLMSAIYLLYYLESHGLPRGFSIKQAAQVINLLLLCDLYTASRDIEVVGLGTVFPVKSMDLVLSSPKWILSLLSTNQSQSLLNSVLSLSEIVSRSLAWKTRQVSSAYRSISQPTAPGRALTYKRNRSGPRIEPWGHHIHFFMSWRNLSPF